MLSSTGIGLPSAVEETTDVDDVLKGWEKRGGKEKGNECLRDWGDVADCAREEEMEGLMGAGGKADEEGGGGGAGAWGRDAPDGDGDGFGG